MAYSCWVFAKLKNFFKKKNRSEDVTVFVLKCFLIYLTGGIAFTQLESKNGFSDNYVQNQTPSGAHGSTDITSSLYGLLFGFGIETLVAEKWSIKLEYLRTDFSNISGSSLLAFNPGISYNQSFSHTAKLTADMVRFGVNYHF